VVADRCRQLASTEQLAGTAPHRVAWLIIEEPDAWPRNALLDSSIDGLPEIAALASSANVGVLLMRHDRRRRPERRVYLANRDGLRTGSIRHLSEVRAWDWNRLALGEIPMFGKSQASLTLVCVHGTRDQCCAIDGRALIRAFAEDSSIVECSHIGGHRFAPVVLHLPSGYLYGRVSAKDMARIIAGEVVSSVLRGCTYDPPPLQVAEQWIRQQTGFTGPDSISPEDCTVGEEHATVSLRVDSREHVVTLRRTTTQPRPESFGAAPAIATSWTVIG
jgi:hypothetical protein